MSTRGYLGLKKNGELKGMYNHFDSYPSGLGVYIIDTLNEIDSKDRVKILNETYDFIQLVDEDSKPTKKQIELCKDSGVANFIVSSKSEDDWYCLLRETQGNLKLYIDKVIPYMLNGNEFINDTLFCEWYYIINLDTKKFECYENDWEANKPVKRCELSLTNDELDSSYLLDL